MSAILQDIRDPLIPLPEFLIVDTSLILRIVPAFSQHPQYNVAIDFLRRLQVAAHQGLVMPLLPLLVLEEFYFKICESYLLDASQSAGINYWPNYYKQNPSAIHSIHSTLEQYYQVLLAFPMVVLEPEDFGITSGDQVPSIADRMTEMIDEFHILPKDASILSEAERLGIFSVATLDSDYERADGFTVFLPV